jgi:hypothetical protein
LQTNHAKQAGIGQQKPAQRASHFQLDSHAPYLIFPV